MSRAVEANADGLVGPTHSFAGLSPGNLASTGNKGLVSDPRGAVKEGLAKMLKLADLGLPQFVLPPVARPDIGFLRSIGFSGTDGEVLAKAWKEAPPLAAAAASASSMWAANAATVTPSADAADGRVHFTPANLLSNLHRSLEHEGTGRALKRLFPDERRFAVHDARPLQPHFADEGAANHVRLCAEHGDPGVNILVYGREAYEAWSGKFPARQTLEASQAIARRHGAARAVFPRQSRSAIDAGAFHNDVVCVGTKTCLFFHERAFEDTAAMREAVSRAAAPHFEPVFVEIAEKDLPFGDAVRSYLFNSMLIEIPGRDRLALVAPAEVEETRTAFEVVQGLIASNGPIGELIPVNVRQSMRNGGGPACLRLRVVLTDAELAATNPAQRIDAALVARLSDWADRRYRDRLSPEDLADRKLITESREALDELTAILGLGSDFYPFQRA